jgi:HK97 gp10 family phage protein
MSVNIQISVQGIDEFALALERFDEATKQWVRGWLAEWAEKVRAQAEKNAPSRTGYLRSSIYAQVQDWVAQIGVEASYAYFVEFGTRYMRAQPYLYPALQQLLPELESYIVGALEQAKTEAGL